MRSRYTSRRSLRSINSSSSDSSSNSSDSSSSSDECAVPVVRPANKLERLRRIFLSQPQESPTARSPRRHARALSPAARSRVFGSPDRIRSRCGSSVIARRHAGSDAEEAKDDGKEGELDSSTDEENTVKQTRLSIDNHIHSLCEQVKRMTMQRESAASQLHTMLDQAIEELQFLKRQEERGLQCHIKQIEEDFALRLEVFEQQYLAKVADIQREMQTAIQQQRASAEATILAAAKQLQEKTQAALLPSSSSSVAGNRASLTAARSHPRRLSVSNQLGDSNNWPGNQSHRADDFHSLSLNFGRNPPRPLQSCNQGRRHEDAGGGGHEADPEQSPVEKQKAKLRALEAKLASFSQDSVERITSELKSGVLKKSSSIRQSEWAADTIKNQPQLASRASAHAEHQANGTWKPTPLSPLRKNRSYWRRGISLEAKTNENEWETMANASAGPAERALKRRESVTKPPLSSRFLLPEEEQELRHLRNSIGLAKDWMERHQ